MMTSTNDKTSNKITFIGFAAALGGLLFGFETAVISGAIELVKAQFEMSASSEGWFVSSALLGCIIGVVITWLSNNRVGRKNFLLFAGLLFLLSSIGFAMASSVSMLISFRLIGGLGVGIASVVSPMYITEFAPARLRGRMVAFYQLAISVGILMAYLSNAWLLSISTIIQIQQPTLALMFQQEVWRGMFLLMGLPSLVFIVTMLLVPESPRWLLLKKESVKALTILSSLYGKEAATRQLESIDHATATRGLNRRSVFNHKLRTPLIIGVTLCVFQQFCGINAIIYYGPKVFKEAGLTDGNALYSQVIIGTVIVLFTIIAIAKSDKLGRKPLMLAGLLGIIISLSIVGLCFYTGYTQGPLLLVMLVSFIACFALSLGPVTWILINEIFPDDVRTKAVAVCTLVLWISAWMVGQFFPWLLANIGPAGVFWIFAGFSIANFIFCRKMIVETKGKTLEEIEVLYVKS